MSGGKERDLCGCKGRLVGALKLRQAIMQWQFAIVVCFALLIVMVFGLGYACID